MSSSISHQRQLSLDCFGRWFFLLLLMLGFVFNISLDHPVLFETEASITQIDDVDYQPDPIEWESKFEAPLPQLQTSVLGHRTQSHLIEVSSSDYAKVHPFFSLAIPPPRPIV